MNQNELYQYIQEKQQNICQICVLQDGTEVYSAGWHDYKETDCAHIMSATKSIVSLLIGIAVDHGMIGSVDDKILSYFPDYRVKRGEKTIYDVTIKHLLTMRAPYKGHGDPWSKVCGSEDWTTASLDFLGGRTGITGEFAYRTVCLHILSGILYKATGMNTVDFANRYLFEPLGIAEHKNFYAKTVEEHKRFTTDKAPRENVWFADPQGIGTPGYGLCMNASDMARIGQLCLQNGVWDGKQIVSSKWLEEMLVPRVIESGIFRGMSYGYLWWIVHPEKNIYAAIGNSGNIIYVDPNRKITVAISAYFKPGAFDRVGFIEDVLLPALLEKENSETTGAGALQQSQAVILERLFALQDKEYQAFQSRLMPAISPETIIGVRTPLLRKLAKELTGTPQAEDFLRILPHEYYEENNLHAFLIEKIRDYDTALTETERFLPYIDNWATCDCFCPKIFAKHKTELLVSIRRWLNSEQIYTVRYAMGMLMRYYLDEMFRPEYLAWVAGVQSQEYYVNMMRAWYFATALAKQPDAALPWLTERRLDVWTHNKTIQKAVESFRISPEMKQQLRELRIG